MRGDKHQRGEETFVETGIIYRGSSGVKGLYLCPGLAEQENDPKYIEFMNEMLNEIKDPELKDKAKNHKLNGIMGDNMKCLCGDGPHPQLITLHEYENGVN